MIVIVNKSLKNLDSFWLLKKSWKTATKEKQIGNLLDNNPTQPALVHLVLDTLPPKKAWPKKMGERVVLWGNIYDRAADFYKTQVPGC